MNIFTYGSLMVSSIFESVTGHTFGFKRATLSGYARFCLKYDCYPGIIEAAGDKTEGMVYFDVDDSSLWKLDQFEGEYYFRTPVPVTIGNKTILDTETYVIKPEYRHILSNRLWDFAEFKNLFQDEFTRKYLGFSATSEKDPGVAT